MEIKFERAQIEDAEKLIEVQNISFYDDFTTYGECPAYKETIEKMENNIKNNIVYKILKDNDIIGDIIVRKLENKRYYLRVICIIPEFQNLGLGQKAIKYIEDNISDSEGWELITPFKSYRNHHFYERCEFLVFA